VSTPPAGKGYFISPAEGPGPGVLLLHSFWGLNRATKDMANRLADEGYTVIAPDLCDGQVFDDHDPSAAMEALVNVNVNIVASLVQSCVGLVQNAQIDSRAPLAVVGFGSGASWALWLSARSVDEIAAVVTYYGTQSIPMDTSNSSYLCHWAETDANVPDLEVADLGLRLQMANRPFTFVHHPDTVDGFAEKGRPGFDEEASDAAWRQTIEFLSSTRQQ